LPEDETEDMLIEKVERKREGEGKEKRGRKRKRGERPFWADKTRGNGVCVAVSINKSRDARPPMAHNPKKGEKMMCKSSAVGGGTGM